ncbi:hypothetical protein PGT21_029209 [Puccinia graminis f. sp. tritici]|uniref:Uncharacterized protein n=1 Tax=Puccinia graminis f. sp. tritici TaxID=56615 RepID=A0A5B0MNT5_PUCGR|nr:hypothetical protein PGT21_029209 [Puccinia graminis f. sp. tritici]
MGGTQRDGSKKSRPPCRRPGRKGDHMSHHGATGTQGCTGARGPVRAAPWVSMVSLRRDRVDPQQARPGGDWGGRLGVDMAVGSSSLCHGDDTDRGAMRPGASSMEAVPYDRYGPEAIALSGTLGGCTNEPHPKGDRSAANSSQGESPVDINNIKNSGRLGDASAFVWHLGLTFNEFTQELATSVRLAEDHWLIAHFPSIRVDHPVFVVTFRHPRTRPTLDRQGRFSALITPTLGRLAPTGPFFTFITPPLGHLQIIRAIFSHSTPPRLACRSPSGVFVEILGIHQ